ncbi:hypothetical protein BDZ97DRAFT_1761909 [Flammula alnicola]|nr:hypothetical protein BDZ97DRAFT_1761909 [Flammula alnicola]
MGHKNYLEGRLAQKEEEIALLESRLQAYTGRLSLLQSRLLSTLDTLDVIQNSQAQELSSLLRTRNRLQEQLDSYIKVVRAAELERDDMRDAVMKLVEKVETSNDYCNWPHSQIRLSSLPDSIPIVQSRRGNPSDDDEEDLISYASSIIESLRRERDNERRAHAQTRESAEARILALEAKLSRREAELEACVAHADHGVSVEVRISPRIKERMPANDLVTSEQIISMLDITVARNKLLESEITTLFKRLEQARATASTDPSHFSPPKFEGERLRKTRTQTRLESRIPSISSNKTPSRPPFEGDDMLDDENDERSFRDLGHNVLRDLERQIQALSQKIDAFAEERNVVRQTLSHNPPLESNSQPDEDIENRLRILETECARLRTSECHLRDELDATRDDARARENDLLDKINSLRSMLAEPPKSTYQTENVSDLLDPDDGEISMELATPLLPMSIIAAQSGSRSTSPHSPVVGDPLSPYVDPPSIPLPPSPDGDSDHTNSPTLSQIMPGGERSRRYQATSSFVAELRQVETQLAITQVQLQAGESALNQLEHLVNELHPP